MARSKAASSAKAAAVSDQTTADATSEPFGGTPVEGNRRGRSVLLVRAKDIEQDIRINRGDHRFPRISEMNASVSKFLPRQPQTRCVGLGSVAFTAISRPRSSLNSSTVPGLTPSRSRKGFGITI